MEDLHDLSQPNTLSITINQKLHTKKLYICFRSGKSCDHIAKATVVRVNAHDAVLGDPVRVERGRLESKFISFLYSSRLTLCDLKPRYNWWNELRSQRVNLLLSDRTRSLNRILKSNQRISILLFQIFEAERGRSCTSFR